LDVGLLEQSAEYVDFAKIGLSMPLMLDKSRLLERIRRYHDLGIKVLSGGTLIEVAVQKGVVPQVLDRLRALGFDMVEVSESAGEMPLETKEMIVNEISELSMECVLEVGSRDRSAASASRMVSRIRQAFELKSRRVVVKVPQETEGAGEHGAQGGIRWDVLNEVAGAFGPPSLVFETQHMQQLTALILEFGPTVNLAGVSLNEALVLEMQRLGLTAETLGLTRAVQSFEGSPAAKFVYHLIKTEHPVDQTTLGMRSGLPRRTIQTALSSLVSSGLIREVSDMSDLRKRRYTMK
jgi:phosphosulfolactate synthase